MGKSYRARHNLMVILCTAVVVILLFASVDITFFSIYEDAREDAFEKLHLETQQIKNDINLQMFSDRENLVTMANFAARLYEEGRDFSLLFESFEEIGLFENVRLLLPDNTVLTKKDKIDATGQMDFNEELSKGNHISGRVSDLVYIDSPIVRSAVPVTLSDGRVVGILYGVINLQKFEDRYIEKAKGLGGDLFIMDEANGNFLLDTRRENFGNVDDLSDTVFRNGYSYSVMMSEISSGKSGFVSFDSVATGEPLYAHYSPLNFANWQIMLAKPEREVFAVAGKTGRYMIVMSSIVFLIMLIYVAIVLLAESKTLKINGTASLVRKTLLEVNRNIDKISESLAIITDFGKARSTFFVDSMGEDYSYINPDIKDHLVSGKDRTYLISEILLYIAKKQNKYGTNVYTSKIEANKSLSRENPMLCDLLKNHGIRTISVASVAHNSSNTSVLGVINSRKSSTSFLIREIAICFSMAVYNKKHLTNTESMALTDALTGVANRMAYKQDIKHLADHNTDRLTCIYIDVNELNFYNNKYGHAAGDNMLVFIARTLADEFSDSHIYRMGGDEFLIFAEGLRRTEIDARLTRANELIEEMKYHVSVGIKKRESNMDIEALVNEAEKRMYVEKAKYYQRNATGHDDASAEAVESEVIQTGIKELDAFLQVESNKYQAIYYVSLESDRARQLVAPTKYFEIPSEEKGFSDIIKQYMHDYVKPEFYRTLLNFMQYDALKKQIIQGGTPELAYVKKTGRKVLLSVRSVPGTLDGEFGTIWTFERQD